MKRHLLLFGLLLAIAGNTVAQEPIAMDGKEWNVKAGHYIYFRNHHMWIDGDTIVNGEACKKLYTRSKGLWDGGSETLTVGYCRQDGEKFYKNGVLMFDFGMQVGDVANIGEEEFEVIDTGRFVTKDGISRKSLTVRISGGTDIWVEGLGSIAMGIYSNNFQPGEMKALVSFSCNNSPIYYHEPIAMEGKEWIFRVQGATPSDIRMWIGGDTIVEGVTCKKLYKHTRTHDGVETLETSYCRQDKKTYLQDNKIMFCFGMLEDEEYLYNETERWPGRSSLWVFESNYTILEDGVSRQYQRATDANGYFDETYEVKDVWIEGVGSKYTGIFGYNVLEEGNEVTLISCSYNGRYIYRNPNVSIEELPYKPSTIDTPYYDLMGRPVAHPTRGIYIKDGRKVVIK